MKKPSYKISCLEDHDMRHYEFTRNSRLPRDTFRDDPWWRMSPDAVVFLASVVAIIVAIAWGF